MDGPVTDGPDQCIGTAASPWRSVPIQSGRVPSAGLNFTRFTLLIPAFAFLWGVSLAPGATARAADDTEAPRKISEAALKEFERADTDKDGLVSLAELVKAIPNENPKVLQKDFQKEDTDKSGQLTPEEFERIVHSRRTLYWAMGIISAVSFFGSLALLPILVARIPENYFVTEHEPPEWTGVGLRKQILLVLKNVIGLVLILAGIAALFLPGQGMLMILLGIILTDLPFKSDLILKIVSRPRIFTALNWIRRKAHQPPLQIPQGLATRNPPEVQP